jgi:hypothetical protein
MATLPKMLRTDEDVDEMARYTKEMLKKAHEAGQEGITIITSFPVFKLTLEEAAIKAGRFLEDSAGVHFHRLQNMREEVAAGIWRAQFDIGILKKKTVEVLVNSQNGHIEGYGPLPEPGKTATF